MSRIASAFKDEAKPLLITFTVAGDPDRDLSLKIIRKIAGAGADIIELGLPFSDPVADGPVIQAADTRALLAGMNTDRFFSLVREFREDSSLPIVVLTYTNLIMRRGIKQFYKDAKDSGIDGIVIADLPYEEASPFIQAADQTGLDQIMMISTTTSTERLEKILQVSSGFIYLVAALGVTGTRSEIDSEAVALLKKVKMLTKIPIAPGFGISNKDQIHAWTEAGADAVIVGSAIVKRIEEDLSEPEKMLESVDSFVRGLKRKP